MQNMDHIKRVYEDTLKHADEYEVEQSEKLAGDSVEYKTPSFRKPNKIFVIHDDPYSAAINIWQRCKESGSTDKYKLGMLCTASTTCPITQTGSGASTGALGYEYELLRISNLSTTLDGNFYPMDLLDIIVCPRISIFKDNKNYEYCDPVPITSIFISCQKNPGTITVDGKQQYSETREMDLMREKINLAFKTASIYDVNCFIISDFGTALFQNHPTEIIISMINDAYAKYPLERVILAIKSKVQPEKDSLFMAYHHGIRRS